MKIMISQPMNGKTNEQIKSERENIVKRLHDMHIEVIDTVFDFEVQNVKNEPVFYLAKSIEKMSNADAVLFMNGWIEARGCRIEHEVARSYGIKILYENFIKNDTEVLTRNMIEDK